ncbi:dynein regulatory complex protein 1 isoform X2 [Belonocnema kinseyi]|nr:dynein regulatory complex protein 1 isoform X2 [Belonocnema kinseyi]XP_033227868.1 dynein regulatory complex protein 1 isoform X2 [Belonocnema kinseyi]XP_033227869.1 dynein regulatory complex protein 1 isoform X2 [Belonocnema kinseyi]XP_033227870.1 dynein regulatory complex protein 1 isoform X2 [Belonocnema kinseyi]
MAKTDETYKQYFEESEEPSVTSSDSNERKLARRLRVQRRQDALRKKDRPEEEQDEDKTLSEKQIIASAEYLEKLITEGNEVTSNVKIANDARELDRRGKENETRNNLLQMLEENSKQCTERYQEINEKWSSILESKDPLDIHAAMMAQNEKCLKVLAMKDSAISELKKELEEADAKFNLDQKKQTEDIDILIERIDLQVNSMANAYRRELVLIENALDSERKTFLQTSKKKWESLFSQRKANEINGIEQRKVIMREFEKEMNRVMTEHHEEYRAQKIKLETECQKLQQQIQEMKAICMLNVEKLNYNYAVLKRREDENAIIKSQQKRRLNKLQDIINDLKKSYVDLEEKTKLEIQKLTDQVLRAHKSILELENKSDHFTAINEKQYLEIWDMNSKIADELLQKILTADKIIFEQALGLEWEPPEQKILRKENLPSYRKAIAVIEQKKIMVAERNKMCEPYSPAKTLEEINLERKMLLRIVEQISDRSGFLIEEKLRALLMKQSTENRIIIRVDKVLQALEIESKEDIELLLNFFLPYAYCPICINQENESDKSFSDKTSTSSIKEELYGKPEEPEDERTRKLIETVKEEVTAVSTHCGSSESSGSIFTESTDSSVSVTDKATIEGSKSNEDLSCDSLSDSKKQKLLCEEGHLFEIRVTHVIKALKEFVEKFHSVKQGEDLLTFKEKLTQAKSTISRNISIEDVTKFWARYREIVNEKRERLWAALLVGLNKYHEILKERRKLNTETESLRRQNAELQRLLEAYKKPENNLPILRLKREDS